MQQITRRSLQLLGVVPSPIHNSKTQASLEVAARALVED